MKIYSAGEVAKMRHIGYRHPETGKESYYPLPRGLTKHDIKAKIKEIEHRIAKYRSDGCQGPFSIQGTDRIDKLTLLEVTEKVCSHSSRIIEMTASWIERNRYSMDLLMAVVGRHLPAALLQDHHIDQFKAFLYDDRVAEYKRKGLTLNHDKISYGVNKELSSIRAVLRFAVDKGIIPVNYLPKIKMMPVAKRLPQILTSEEIIAMANAISKPVIELAFWIYLYTGARRVEVARRYLHEDRGLKWKHVNWFNNSVRLFSKGKERIVPLHDDLRKRLLERKSELGGGFDREDHIIRFTADPITQGLLKAKRAAGIDKPGSVHILRHTAATIMLELSGGNIRLVQEWLGQRALRRLRFTLT